MESIHGTLRRSLMIAPSHANGMVAFHFYPIHSAGHSRLLHSMPNPSTTSHSDLLHPPSPISMGNHPPQSPPPQCTYFRRFYCPVIQME
ncbi:hypothetical protein AVEN_180138-1 [Araneus ventricosus]|uniref:Uncharacterized protein n=1 Tax=Araneus ventricosus TaxID=182803 RepID=A0A4Y2D647_ARAVE|nr:hypothetical protein AVEN_180138-1 [Araneus ventricosus]